MQSSLTQTDLGFRIRLRIESQIQNRQSKISNTKNPVPITDTGCHENSGMKKQEVIFVCVFYLRRVQGHCQS